MAEIKVGERFSVTLEIVEQNSCDGCFFGGRNGFCLAILLGMECSSDGKNVIFKEVKE